MKKIFLLIGTLMLASINILQSQNKYFEQTYKWENIHAGRVIFCNNTQNYCDVLGNSITTGNILKGFMLRINLYGDTIMLKEYASPYNQLVVYDAIKTQFGYAIATCVSQYEGDEGCKAGILLLNSSGDVLYSGYAGELPLSESRARSLLQTADGGYILAGLITPSATSTNKLYTVKLKADGGTEWEKVYDYFPYHNMFMDIHPAPEGGYYAIASIRRWAEYTTTFPIVLQYMGDILLYKLDDWGNVEWQKIYFEGGDEESPIAFCQTPDNNIYIAGAKNIYEEMFISLSNTFDVAACLLSGVNTGQPSFISTMPDGNFLISGVSVQSGTDGYLKKISPSGTVKWKRVYGDAGHDYFYTHHILPDGSIIVGGRNDMSSTAAVYIVKTNCMGLLTEPQAAFSYEAQGGFNNLVQFTNLSQYVYADSIDGGKYIWDWGDGSIPSVFGTEAFSQVNHYYPAPGIYPVTLYAIVCQDTSMVQALVDTQGGSGTVGIAQTPHHVEEHAFRVYPNPAQNTLHFTFTNSLNPPSGAWELSISLYTPQGQLATRHTAPGGATIQLPTDTLPSGIYYCHIQVNGQLIQTEKIAIIR